MNRFNVPPRIRALIYVLNVLGTPVVVYAVAKDWIGDLELTLWGAEVAAAMALAGLNLPAADEVTPRTQRGAIDVGTAVVIAILVLLLLVLVGVLR